MALTPRDGWAAALEWRAVLDRRQQEWIDAAGAPRLVKLRHSWQGPGAIMLGASAQPGPALASAGAGPGPRLARLSGEADVELNEGGATSLLGSSLRLELVSMPKGFDPALGPNGGLSAAAMAPDQLEVLGIADFPLGNVVEAPQPEFVLTSALLDDTGSPVGEALVEVVLTPDDLLLDYFVGGVILRADAIDLTTLPAFWAPPLPDLAGAQSKYDAAASAAQKAVEAAQAAAAGAAANYASSKAELTAAANGAGGEAGVGKAAAALSKAEAAMEKARAAVDAAQKVAAYPASLALIVGEAVQAAADAGGNAGLVPPALADVSTAFGAQSLTPAPPVFKFCTLNGFDLAACLQIADEASTGASKPVEEGGAAEEGEAKPKPRVASKRGSKVAALPPSAEAEAAAAAAVAGRAGWRVRWGASARIWLAAGSQQRLKTAAQELLHSPSIVSASASIGENGDQKGPRAMASCSLRFELTSTARDPTGSEQMDAPAPGPFIGAGSKVTVEVPLIAMVKSEQARSGSSGGSRPGTAISSRSAAPPSVALSGSDGGNGVAMYRSRFSLPSRVELSTPVPKSSQDTTEGISSQGGEMEGSDEDGEQDAVVRRTVAADALFTVTLSASRPLVLPPPPPAPVARSRVAKSRRQKGDGPSPAQALAALPPLLRLGAMRRFPWAVLPISLPPQRAAPEPPSSSGSVVAATASVESTPVAPRAAGTPSVNWRRMNAWSSADPLVAALLPFRSIESPSVQLMKKNPVDDLERDINNFVNTLADEIRIEFRLDDRVWQDDGADGPKALERRKVERRRLTEARANAGLDPAVLARAKAAESQAVDSSKCIKAPPGVKSPRNDDESEAAAEVDFGDSAANLIFRLNASGQYHKIAEAVRKPVAHFVHFKIGRPLRDGEGSTSAGDRYVCEAYAMVAGLTTRILNKLFRSAELYEDQPAARQEAKDALAKLMSHVDRLETLATDAECGGRLRVAEVRFRVRIKLIEAAADQDSPLLVATEEERQAGAAIEAEPGSLLLGNLVAPALVRARLDLAEFLLRNRVRSTLSAPLAAGGTRRQSASAGAELEDGGGLTLGAAAATRSSFAPAATVSKQPIAAAMIPCHPLSVPGLGLGDAAYGGLDGSADLDAVRAGLDGLSQGLKELRAVGSLVVGGDGNGLPLKLRQETLMMFGATLLEHEVAACPAMATWADECGAKPWAQLLTTLPPFSLPEELPAGAASGSEGLRLQPRRWSVAILEHAVRIALSPDPEADMSPEGFGPDEVLECRSCPGALLAVLAVALVATDSRRRGGYGSGAYGFEVKPPTVDPTGGQAKAGDGDPLAYSFGHEVRARALVRLAAEKRRREFNGEKKRLDEDDETMVLLQASEWLSDNRLNGAASVALVMAKAASNRAQRCVRRLLLGASGAAVGPTLLSLTPRPLRVLSKLAVARLSFARVPVNDADAASFRGDKHSHFEVVAAEGGVTFSRPTKLSHAALLALAADRIEDAIILFPTASSAPVELLLLAADRAWAGRMQASKKAAELNEKARGRATVVLRAVSEVRSAYGTFVMCATAQGQTVPLRAFARLGAAMAELGDLDDAVDIYRQGCKAWGDCASVWKGLGLCLLQQLKFDEAEVALDLSNERDTSDALTWGCLALCNLRGMLRDGSTGNHYRMGTVSDSINEALDLGLDDVPLLFDLALCFASCDRYVEGARLLRVAIGLRNGADDRASKGAPGAAAAAAALPSVQVMRNCLADSLKSQGNDLEALDEYQAVFEKCVGLQETELGAIVEAGEAADAESASGTQAVVPVRNAEPSEALVSAIKELNRAAAGIEILLTKLGRASELKQLRYTVKIINARLRLVTERAKAQ